MIRAVLGVVADRFLFGRNVMYCQLYLRKGKVLIPTFGRVDKGLYRDIEPVAVVDVSDTGALRQAFHETIARGNPPTPYYPRGGPYPQPVVVKHAGVKSWSAFARGASPWNIKESDGIYQIVGHLKGPSGWVEDHERRIEFPPGTTLDQVIDRMIVILQEEARK
jgi:hypothetical protein